eukprot:TRINITY_DN17947_c1_g1_i4.p1 TRINITY_DN17947_c1_g1~~TRINITY_DN17947_c1_g1_i4.p1  ORF type:complete len:126 (-),score=24.16 TRINITY_DN17947_c1_g1_i4:110-487(-)
MHNRMSRKAEQTPALHNLWMMTNKRIQMQKDSSWPELITVVHPNLCFSKAFGAYALRHASLDGFPKKPPSLSLSESQRERERERGFFGKPCKDACLNAYAPKALEKHRFGWTTVISSGHEESFCI